MEFQNSCDISDSAKFSKNLEIPPTNELTDILRLQSECTYVILKGKIICQTTPAQRKLTYDAEPSYVDFKL